MDGSAFRHFPAGALLWWALIGMAVTAVGALAGLVAAIWWVANHIVVV